MVNTAAVVYVFLDDAQNVVSSEDIKEWLQIIDEVVEIKLQYDAVSRRTCYSVEFRKPTSAQQAVQYLNGSRFKNCLVSIRSRVFAALDSGVTDTDATIALEGAPMDATSSPAASSSSLPSTRKSCRETEALPFNHLLPADLQMDQLLVEQLPEAAAADGFDDVAGLWRTLKVSQEKLASTYQELDRTKNELTVADAQLAKLLRVQLSTSAADADLASSTAANRTTTLTDTPFLLVGRRCVSHQRGISMDAYTPSGVVSFVTTSFGPVSFCSVSAIQGEFFLVLRFVFLSDEERFLVACTSAKDDSRGSVAKTEKEKTLIGLAWTTIDFTITPRDFSALSPAEVKRQDAVRQLLS